jgi:septal ring factor EnvC (AmiA/AmiB activator)
VASARKEADEVLRVPTEDMRLSGKFEANRGRLPIPITGPYRIVSHFGQYNVEGLKNVTLDNKGINIRGEAGAQARSIFDGEVSYVFGYGGSMVVMVRHGSYISVYCNLASVNVRRGQHVSTRQSLGRIGQDNILQFQLRRETAKLNPESWLGR